MGYSVELYFECNTNLCFLEVKYIECYWHLIYSKVCVPVKTFDSLYMLYPSLYNSLQLYNSQPPSPKSTTQTQTPHKRIYTHKYTYINTTPSPDLSLESDGKEIVNQNPSRRWLFPQTDRPPPYSVCVSMAIYSYNILFLSQLKQSRVSTYSSLFWFHNNIKSTPN